MTELLIDDYQQKITDFINEQVEEQFLNSIGGFKLLVNEIKGVCLKAHSGMTQDQLIEIIKEVQELLKYMEIR